MKQKLLFLGIRMDAAGTEKSFLSFLSALDFDRYEVDLLLAEADGLFLSMIPPQVRVMEMKEYGALFTMSGKTAARTLFNLFVKKNILTGFEILPYFLTILFCKKKRTAAAEQLWCHMMQKLPEASAISDSLPHYDAAIAYWGDRTMFYMIDKVGADKKIAWLHFDYGNPPRDDSLYLPYFEKCDRIVTVSREVDKALKEKLPAIAERTVMMENIMNPDHIRAQAKEGDTFPDAAFEGKRLLTVGRICPQKGSEIIIPVLKRLKENGYPVRWYLVGTGEADYVSAMKDAALQAEVADCLFFLGVTPNPYRYINDCDIYVQPSRYEGKPITVEEAKILCKPIVCADYLSAREQLQNGVLGKVCAFDEEELYLTLRRMVEDAALRDALTAQLSRLSLGNRDEMKKFETMMG